MWLLTHTTTTLRNVSRSRGDRSLCPMAGTQSPENAAVWRTFTANMALETGGPESTGWKPQRPACTGLSDAESSHGS